LSRHLTQLALILLAESVPDSTRPDRPGESPRLRMIQVRLGSTEAGHDRPISATSRRCSKVEHGTGMLTHKTRNSKRADGRWDSSLGILCCVANRVPELDIRSSTDHPNRRSAQYVRSVYSKLHLYGCGGWHKCSLVMGFGKGNPSEPFASSSRIEVDDCSLTDQPVRTALSGVHKGVSPAGESTLLGAEKATIDCAALGFEKMLADVL